ncbi:MAG: exodeoxyribonuclease VII small subunit [Thermodesulfobacteriota bacterium]
MARKTFEDAMQKLEAITQELENGELSLEASLKKFDEGIKLADFCNKRLEESQQKVNMLLEKDGEMDETPFATSDDNGS